MEPGPLPPHERTWRHPSELGPTKLDVDDGHGNHFAALIVGALAVVSVAAMVVVMTPRTGSGPVAISATTTPITQRATLSPPGGTTSTSGATTGVSARPSAARASASVLLTTFAAMPHTVSAGPQLDVDGTDIADEHPDGDDAVFVRTGDVTYRLNWAQVPMLDPPDGSVVFDENGDLVAHVSGGELISLVGD